MPPQYRDEFRCDNREPFSNVIPNVTNKNNKNNNFNNKDEKQINNNNFYNKDETTSISIKRSKKDDENDRKIEYETDKVIKNFASSFSKILTFFSIAVYFNNQKSA
ncbi:hypothetical protein ACTFIW_009644 [Dictyostelium discoideum]